MHTRTAVVITSATVVLGVAGASAAVATDTVRVSAGANGVKVCLTKKNVVVGASKKSRCPKGSKKKAVAVRGPRGLRGPAGAQGPAGSATAYGVVSADGALVTGSPNAVSARRTGVGAYCVTFRRPLPENRLASALATSNDVAAVAINPDRRTARIACPSGELVVWTFKNGEPGVGRDAGFQFLVP